MKTTQASFLFFVVAALYVTTPGFGQLAADSTFQHYTGIIHPETPDDLPEGIAFYTEELEKQLEAEDIEGAIESLRMLAIGQYKIGSLYDSENSIVAALELIHRNEQKDPYLRAQIGLYNQLGRVYRTLQNQEAAINALDKALQLADNPADRIIILNNKANLFKDNQQYELALDQYHEVSRLLGKNPDSLRWATVLDNFGAVLSHLRAPAALDSLQKALRIRLEKNELTGVYSSYRNLAQYYAMGNDTTLALSYAKKAQATAEQLNSPSFRYDALELLAILHNDPDISEYRRLTDSLERARQLAENKNAFIKYNIGEERKKTAEQALQKERAQRSKQLFQLSTVGILLLLILSYFLFRYHYKKGRQEEMYRTESRISKKVHDELANDLFHALAYAEAHPLQEPEEKEKLLTSLDRLYAKTRDISKDTAPIPTGTDFPNYLRELLAGFSADKVNVILNGLESLPWSRISELKKMACFRILQELLVNMKKHSDATLVLLSFAREGKYIRILYSDNGRGIAPGAPLERGGLRIAENRMAAIKGTFTFENQASGGFRCQLRFPL